MKTTAAASSSGMSTLSVLGIVFIVLKLLGVITWSWWWVTAPFWGGFAFVLVILLFTVLIFGIAAARG